MKRGQNHFVFGVIPGAALLFIAGSMPMALQAQSSSGVAVDQHVILKTGSVFSGTVERSGGQTTIRTAGGVVVRLDQSEIDFVTDSLDYAASRLANRMIDDDPQDHLRLANWCLRHGALDAARREIAWLQQAGETAEARSLQRRCDQAEQIRSTASSPSAQPPVAAPVTRTDGALRELPPSEPRIASREQLRSAVESLSRPARREFTSQVHNRIVNGCAAANCHGNAKSTMRLWRPEGGRGLDSTGAQRNLHAILQQINRYRPQASPFLDYLSEAHGGQETGTFAVDSTEWKEIRDWVISTSMAPSVDAAEVGLATWQQTLDPHADASSPSGDDDAPRPVDLMSAAARGQQGSSDPFDPRYFNEHFGDRSRHDVPPKRDVPPGASRPLPSTRPLSGKSRPLPPVDDQ